MTELARRVGIDVPETALLPIDEISGLPEGLDGIGKQAFGIKRFDRSSDGPVHIEDFAQIFGVFPERQYKSVSYRNMAEVIWIETGEPGLTQFIRRFVFNALIGYADMHLKNWSMIYRDTRTASLAPAYDFVSTVPYFGEDSLALTIVDSKAFASLTTDQFARFAGKANLPERLVLTTLAETVDAFARAWSHTDDLPLDSDVRTAIERHLQTVPIWKKSG